MIAWHEGVKRAAWARYCATRISKSPAARARETRAAQGFPPEVVVAWPEDDS